MCSLRQTLWSLIFGSSIIYVVAITLFQYNSTHTCNGDWGNSSPLLSQKSGKGKCNLTFRLDFLSNSLLTWESSYDGQWREGKKDGTGLYKSLSGASYQGDWRINMRHGAGTFYSQDGTKYEGKWFDDEFSGDDNKLQISLSKNKYPEASQLLNNSYYLGAIKNGLMQGEGTIHFGKGGRKIAGKFQQGKLHGPAEVTLKNGETVKIEEFTDEWSLGSYTAKASITATMNGKLKWMEWDGITLRLVDEGVSANTPSQDTEDNSTKLINASLPHKKTQEVYEILNALKWFEGHFIFTHNYVTTDIYAFDFVDGDSQEKYLKKLEEKKEL